MIECLRNENGDIVAICEYIIINDQCEEEPSGNRCFIRQFEVNKDYRNRRSIQKLVKQMMLKHPKTNICEWYRMDKYPDRKISRVTRQQGYKLTREV